MNPLIRFPQAAGVAACKVKRAAVIGAGSMGGGIAAQFANAGIPVDLLDIAAPEGEDRDAIAKAGIERQLKANGFAYAGAADLVRAGNIDDNLDRLAEADWIVEVIIENVDLKRRLYSRIDKVRKRGSIVSSNTSTILRRDLLQGTSEDFAADFVITHFFNPPRLMRLVELVTDEENRPEIISAVRQACEVILGKTVVECRDSPGFIANRIGCHWLAVALIEAERHGMTVEEADAVMAAFGIPKTGAFGLMDLIGIDLVPHVWASLQNTLPQHDGAHDYDLTKDALIERMIAQGRFGRKSKAGFYRLAADRSREALDLKTGEYRPETAVKPSDLPGGGRDLAKLLDNDGKFGRYAWQVLSQLLVYAAGNSEEIAESIADIDTAIVLGYGWREGPFALADRYGADRIAARLKEEGRAVPARMDKADERRPVTDSKAPDNVFTLSSVKARGPRLAGNNAASLWESGDGVAIFEIHTKMNCLPPEVIDVLEQTVQLGTEGAFRALVIGNDDPRAFSVGADLAFFLGMVENAEFDKLENYLMRGQQALLAMKFAAFPVVAAAHGLVLGGGCELMMHAHAIVAHVEMNAGLPETKVGIIPGWGGCKELLLRSGAEAGRKDSNAAARAVFELLMSAKPSRSAFEAMGEGILRTTDTVVMNRDLLLSVARQKALAMADAGHRPLAQALVSLSGPPGKTELMNEANRRLSAGQYRSDDIGIADTLSTVLTGGASGNLARPMTEAAVMHLELQAVLALAREPATQSRIKSTLGR